MRRPRERVQGARHARPIGTVHNWLWGSREHPAALRTGGQLRDVFSPSCAVPLGRSVAFVRLISVLSALSTVQLNFRRTCSQPRGLDLLPTDRVARGPYVHVTPPDPQREGDSWGIDRHKNQYPPLPGSATAGLRVRLRRSRSVNDHIESTVRLCPRKRFASAQNPHARASQNS